MRLSPEIPMPYLLFFPIVELPVSRLAYHILKEIYPECVL